MPNSINRMNERTNIRILYEPTNRCMYREGEIRALLLVYKEIFKADRWEGGNRICCSICYPLVKNNLWITYISAMNPLPQPKHSSLYLYKCKDVYEHPFALIYIKIYMLKHTTALEPTQLYISWYPFLKLVIFLFSCPSVRPSV